jgi:hypothetical protein
VVFEGETDLTPYQKKKKLCQENKDTSNVTDNGFDFWNNRWANVVQRNALQIHAGEDELGIEKTEDAF